MAEREERDKQPKPPKLDPDPAEDAFRRMVVGRSGKDGVKLPDDQAAKQKYPTLWKFLTERNEDKRFVVEPGRLTISLGLGCWIVNVSHGDYRTKLEASSLTLEGALEAWERAATSANAPWKYWGKGELTLRKRRKEENT